MSFQTFSQFQDSGASEKTGLCIIEAAKRLVGWTLYSGSIYSIPFSESSVITSVEDDETALAAVTSLSSVTAGKYFFDVGNDTLYARLSDSTNPDDSFIGVVFKYFFSNTGVKAPHDLSTGFDVYWMPLLSTMSDFRLEVDNKDTQLGLAIEGSGNVKLINDQSFWQSRYDKVFFENQRMYVYLWERNLPITEAQILFKGRIQNKSYTTDSITFQAKDVLNELRDVFVLSDVGDFTYSHAYFSETVSARVDDSQSEAKQRLIYGKPNGVVAMNVDQVLPDTPDRRTSFETGYKRHNNGTFTVTASSKNVSANGTFRTVDLMPGDQILFSNDLDNLYTVDYYTNLTDFVLTEDFLGASSATVTARIFPQRQRRIHNRHFLVAGHPLSEVSTTVSSVIDGSHFNVTSTSGLIAGDNIVITIGSTDYQRTIERITGSMVTISVLISPSPSIGDAVKRVGVQKVYLDSQLLIYGEDYTVDSENALVKLTNINPDVTTGIGCAEFNHTKVQSFSGRVTFTNGSFQVTKSSTPHSDGEVTSFTTQFRPGDYIQQPNGVWREVWYVVDDDNLVLSGLATQTADSENGLYKAVEYYQEGTNKIICDVRGKTDDGTTSGAWLRYAPEIVEDILISNGLSGQIDSASFATASELAPFDVGLVVPDSVDSKDSSEIRKSISDLSRSIFGTLLQSSSLNLSYKIISADKVSLTTYDRTDVIDFRIDSNSSKIVKDVVLSYDPREADFTTGSSSTTQVVATSEIGQKLLKIDREFKVDTKLVDSSAATIMAGRWSFLLELATSKLTAQMKIQGSDISVGDPIQINHEKLYNRMGSSIKRRLGVVSLVTRGVTKSSISIDDLSNAFTRVATIAAADAPDYVDATEAEKVISGYITAANGLLDSDPETHGLNVQW